MKKTKLDWCLEKEQRLKKITPNKEKAKEHLNKAEHNLKAMIHSKKGGFTDWSVAQSYYTIYHALLAIAYKNGYESKNHECTLTLIEKLIQEKKLTEITTEEIQQIRNNKQPQQDTKALREDYQYGVRTKAEETLLEQLEKQAKNILEKTTIEIEKE